MTEPLYAQSTPLTIREADTALNDPDMPFYQTLPVVAIGASAGGLEACRQFFAAMPSNSGIAFVLIQHLAPNHDSLMAELLIHYTTMQVIEARHGMRVEANHVYVIPPNYDLTIHQSKLSLTPSIERYNKGGIRTPIDFFFYSLANDLDKRAVGIILSGAGADGTLGLQAIKQAGGLVIVQDPITAQYDGMLRSALATGVADHVLPADQMPDVLLNHIPHIYSSGGFSSAIPNLIHYLDRILAIIQAHTGYDFSGYKRSTLIRRIDLRMSLRNIAQIDDYIQDLHSNPEETLNLFRELLISVTSFFRDPEIWQYLEENVICKLVEETPPGGCVRVWVPGCASGEEPYTIATLLLNQIYKANKVCRAQIFATDIDEHAINQARVGLYPGSISADVPPAHLNRFFTREGEFYRVNKELREIVIFSEQNLISDPPFSKLDLISCRNLFIYFQPEMQQKVLELFHYSLHPERWLILGTSESIGNHQDLFKTSSKELRIYQRLGTFSRHLIDFPIHRSRHRLERPMRRFVSSPLNLMTITQQQLLREFAPPTLLINSHFDVLYMQGAVRNYLDFSDHEQPYNLMKMIKQGLQRKVRTALTKAMREHKPVTISDARIKRGTSYVFVSCYVRPITDPKEAQDLLLVTFQDIAQQAVVAGSDNAKQRDGSSVQQFKDDIKKSDRMLKRILTEIKTDNERLSASNEEMTSMFEELQVAKEEIETSKEALQSLNKELTSLNIQLQTKVHELEKANDDLLNLQVSTKIAMFFLDTHLRIQRFNTYAQQLMHLISADIGRPVMDLSANFIAYTDTQTSLKADAEAVLDTLIPIEREVQTIDGLWFTQRIFPYRTATNKIDGVVITFINVTQFKTTQKV